MPKLMTARCRVGSAVPSNMSSNSRLAERRLPRDLPNGQPVTRHRPVLAGRVGADQQANPLQVQAFRHPTAWAGMGGNDLITRRSQVQVLPPPPTKRGSRKWAANVHETPSLRQRGRGFRGVRSRVGPISARPPATPWWFSNSGDGRFELNCHSGHGTCYLADSPLGCLLETIWRDAAPTATSARRSGQARGMPTTSTGPPTASPAGPGCTDGLSSAPREQQSSLRCRSTRSTTTSSHL